MCCGLTVRIKTCSVTTWTGRMTPHVVWDWAADCSRLVVAKVPSPKLLHVRLATRVRVSPTWVGTWTTENGCSFWLLSISVITLNDSISNYRRGLVHSCRLLTSTGRSVWSLHWPAEWPETPVQCRPVRPPMISEETALPRICWAHIAPVNHITAHCQSQFNVISTSSV